MLPYPLTEHLEVAIVGRDPLLIFGIGRPPIEWLKGLCLIISTAEEVICEPLFIVLPEVALLTVRD